MQLGVFSGQALCRRRKVQHRAALHPAPLLQLCHLGGVALLGALLPHGGGVPQGLQGGRQGS